MKLEETFKEVVRDVRLKYFFAGENLKNKDDNYHPKLYIKSDWDPPPACEEVERRLTQFYLDIIHHKSKFSPTPTTNISRLQYRALKFLKNNPIYIVAQADKNLGPVLIERDVYIKTVFQHHLSNKETYTQISINEFRDNLAKIKKNHR